MASESEVVHNTLASIGMYYMDGEISPQEILFISSRLERYAQEKINQEEVSKRTKLRKNLSNKGI